MGRYIIKLGIIFGLIIVLTSTSHVIIENAKGTTQGQQQGLEPGDYINMTLSKDLENYWFLEIIEETFFNGMMHVVMYAGEENDEDWFVESSWNGVRKSSAREIDELYDFFSYYSVIDDEGKSLDPKKKLKALGWAWPAMDPVCYQYFDIGYLCHLNFTEIIDPEGKYCMKHPTLRHPLWSPLMAYIFAKNFMVPCFSCAELIWAAYMNIEPKYHYNIMESADNLKGWGVGDGWEGIWVCNMKQGKFVKKIVPMDPPFPPKTKGVKGTVNGNLIEDDPENYTWTTIQKGIDNLSTMDTLFIKNGNYTENIIINKSMVLIGEDKNNVSIYGTIIMVDNQDYELPDYGKNSIIVNLNMSGNELLLHLNNDSNVGENYSSSNIVYDYSGQGNNGTNNGAIWTTNTIKGNGSFDFDGINDKINLTNIPTFAGENLTVSSWIYWNEGTGTDNPIISQSNSTHGYCLYVNNTSKKPAFKLDEAEALSSVNISNGWHHIVGTHNETTLKIHINGTLVGTCEKNGSGINITAFVGFDNVSNYFNGLIDEIAVWNRTFTDNEIAIMYKANLGAVIKNLTLKNGDIGLILNNNSEMYSCDVSNFSVGIQMRNVTESCIIDCNISDCDTAIRINNSNPGKYEKIRIALSIVNNCTDGLVINSSSKIGTALCYLNCSNFNIQLYNCNFNDIMINNCSSPGNILPDVPSIPSGVTLGDPGTKYTYTSVTNDSNNDQIFYKFYWDDGNITDWLGPYQSNEAVSANHTWSNEGGYHVLVMTRDILNNEINWSEPLLFQTEILPPLINTVNNTPDIVGFGNNITITVNATDDQSSNNSGIKYVKGNITYPDNSYNNITLTSMGNNTYQHIFDDTWTVGRYNYTIWAFDKAYNYNSSTGHSFNVSSQATIKVCTIKDNYGNNETVNLTDPPTGFPLIGHELLDDGGVLHIWNKYDSYYFNTSSGIQLTNHYDEYWSHNVLMLGYYTNDQWNLIYRNDELSGFNKEIDTDNWTYVNVTLWKNLTYEDYDFRLAIRYHLGIDDNELTVIPSIKNIDDENITYTLGFAWEINDIQVDMTYEGDYIEINNSVYNLNETLDLTFTNMTSPCYYIREDMSNSTSESLYLRWNESLDYKVQVKSKEGEYNAPVTLGIKIGTLNVDQEKHTSIFWYDASEVVYYFDNYHNVIKWDTSPGNMVDGSTSTFASTTTDFDVEICDGNTCSGSDLGPISKVEVRCHGKRSGSGFNPPDIILRPLGANHVFSPSATAAWSSWYDITSDPAAPNPWIWNDIVNLNCEVEAKVQSSYTVYCSKVEIRVTYTPPNAPPGISSPYPADGTTGISIQPVLNITVSDDEGDTMNITWLSNSSGSWQVFGTNNSVGNGTYHQIMSNASVNGQWWYWKVNVTDGFNYTESSVYKFYTGYQSKLINTGNFSIKGYLLIQVQYYNTTNSTWVVADDTINDTSPRTIKWEDEGPFKTEGQHILGLDTIFNGRITTEYLSNLGYGNGTYRIYAAFRGPDGDVLVCNDSSELIATYEFTVTFE